MRSSAEKVAYTSVFVCVALMLSYLESFLPYLPIPGFKPGLANLAVMISYFCLGLTAAATVSVCRILLSSLLFGSPVSLIFSLVGGILSLGVLALYGKLMKRVIGAVGLGVLCAAIHCVGQCIAASALYGAPLLFTYLPWLLVLSVATGALTGALTHATVGRLKLIIRSSR
ncbi:MAG: Gx transporter family protein [Clostridia bacterium]|nr:Gx transporter family protein [Clostridia bacterium]